MNRRKVYTGINHTILNIRNYWRKCFILKKKSRRGYNSDEDDYIIKTRAKVDTNAKTDIIKTKTKTKTQTKDNTKIETETCIDIAKTEPCWVCGDKFKNHIGLQIHMNKHMRERFISNDLSFANNYTIESSVNQRQLYINKPGSYINDINEPIDYILGGFKPFKSYKCKVTAYCLYKKRGE